MTKSLEEILALFNCLTRCRRLAALIVIVLMRLFHCRSSRIMAPRTFAESFQKKSAPFTGQILSTCAVLQDAFAPAQFEWAHSGDKDQGERTMPLERVFLGQKYFIASLSAGFVSKLINHRKNDHLVIQRKSLSSEGKLYSLAYFSTK